MFPFLQSEFFDPKYFIENETKDLAEKCPYMCCGMKFFKNFSKKLADFLQLTISNPKYYMKSKTRLHANDGEKRCDKLFLQD